MITLDGVPIADLGMFVLQEGDIHPSPEYTHKTVKVPGQDGEYDFGTEVGSRPHEVPLGVMEDSQAESQEKIRQFFELVLDDYGKPKPVKMVYDYEPDKYYTIKVSGSFAPERSFDLITGPIVLVAHDPKAYALAYNHDINWDSEVVTFDDPYTFDVESIYDEHITSNTKLEVYVHGLAFKPRLVINGSGRNLRITANGKGFNLKSSFTDAEIVVDGTKNKDTVTKNDENIYDELEGDFLVLGRGMNEIEISGDGLDFTLSIPFQDSYM